MINQGPERNGSIRNIFESFMANNGFLLVNVFLSASVVLGAFLVNVVGRRKIHTNL